MATKSKAFRVSLRKLSPRLMSAPGFPLVPTVPLPMDSAAYERKLTQLIADSKLEKKVVEIANEDFTKSFNR